MNTLLARACGASALLFFVACSGDPAGAGSKTPPTPQPKPVAEPAAKPEAKAPAEAAAKPEAKAAAEPAAKPEAKAPAEAAAKPEAKAPAGEAAAKPEAQNPAPASGQAPKPLPRVRIDYETVKVLFGKDPVVDEIDNPATPEKLALGKLLFHEPSLSKGGNLSCASCHDLKNYGVDGKPIERNTPTVWNASRQFRQFWDGRAATVEEHAAGDHGGIDESQLVAKIQAKPELAAGFQKAFQGADAVSVANFKLALGAFERSLVTKSKFDEYLDGNQKALDNDALFGLKTFMEVGCMTCHTTRLVGGHMFQKLGVKRAFPTKDEGRKRLTGSDADAFYFKVPSLQNVEKTAPYFHDGTGKSLEEVVKTMADVQLDVKLSDDQLRGLVAFLKSLTGPLPADYAAKK